MPPLPRLLAFSDLLSRYQRVHRSMFAGGEDRQENDAEHSYKVAMLAWYLIDAERLALDKAKVLTYALAHDLVEVHAGDTFAFDQDAARLNSKPEREAAAQERLRREHAEFAGLHAAISAYNARADAESRFVYALDKLEPMLAIFGDGGRSWRHHGLTLDAIVAYKESKVALDPTVRRCFEDLLAVVQENRAHLFGDAAK
jgi:putative hydrolase of HD superfamily